MISGSYESEPELTFVDLISVGTRIASGHSSFGYTVLCFTNCPVKIMHILQQTPAIKSEFNYPCKSYWLVMVGRVC